MFWAYVVLGFAVFSAVVLPAYLRWSEKSLQRATVVWRSVAPRVVILLENPKLPDMSAAHLAVGSLIVGSGGVTTAMIGIELQRIIGREPKNLDKAADELSNLSKRMRSELEAVLYELIEFDSLNVPIRRQILKALISWNSSRRTKPRSDAAEIAEPALVATVRVAQAESRNFGRSGFPPELEKYSKELAFG